MEKVLEVYLLGSSASTPFPSESEQIVVTDFDYNAPRMGIPSISASVKHRLCLDNLWSDKVYVEFNGEKYFVRNTPSSKKSNDDTRYGHEINFTSERDKLNHVYFIDAVQDDSDTDAYKSNSTKVMFFGNLSQFVERLNSSLAYSNTGYTAVVDSGITTEDKQVSFEDQYVMQSLQTAFETFEIPYYFVGKVIHFGYTPNALTEVFKYGDKNSLISISKENANYQIVNRITGRGSTDNIPLYYPNKSPKGDISAVVQSAGGITTSNVTITDYEKFAKMDATKSLQYTPSTAQYVSGRYVRKENGSVVTDVDGLANPMNITLELNKKLEEIPMEFDNVYELTSGTSIVFDIELLREGAPISLSLYLKKAVAINSSGEEVSTGKMVSSSTGTYVAFDNLSENGQYTFRYYFTFSRNYTNTVKIRFGTAPKAAAYWMYDGEVVELSDFGLRVNGTPAAGDKIVLNVDHYIPTSTNLLPSIYRESEGAKRFIDAKNDTYEDENGGYYEFENEYSPNNPLEGIQDFGDIKPSITGITNAAGQPIDKFLEFAYDLDDNDEVDDEGNYLHPYFFAKLPKTDGTYGFNLFDQAIESQAMQISFTSGICGACTFEIGVGEETQKNLVQVAPSGALLRDEGGNVLWENQSPQDEQNDTRTHEVWIALKKDNTTYPQVMPNVSRNYKPSVNDTFVILGIKLPEAYLLAAEKRLDDALIKYMWENNVEKFTFSASFSRIYFDEHPEVLEQLNENARVTIEYNNKQYTLYVSEFTYKMSSSYPLPEISISLVDVISVGSNTLQSTVESIAQGLISGITTNNDFVRQGIRYFLRKDVQDTARGKITFLQGIDVGTYSENSGGGTMRILEDLSSYAEVDRLRVRVKAYFETLEIINTNSVGGKMILTAGGGVYLREVVEENDHYRCFFLTTQDGRTIENRFKVGDLAISQSFNVEAGVHQGISNHYYWREVVGVGSDYVDLSKSICDTGSDVPMAEDTLVHLGNRSDKDRQGAIIFSAVDVFSPSITLYYGINDFSLVNKDYVSYGVDKSTGNAFFRVYGEMYAGDREQTSYVKYTPGVGVEMRGKFLNQSGESYDTIIDSIQNAIDGNIETWFGEEEPTLSNEPAVNWTTDEDKNTHLGDLYYSDAGVAYRFQMEGAQYVWKMLKDSDITKALADAKAAKDAADAAQEAADAAADRLTAWASDGVISPTEKQGIKDEIARIDADKANITAQYTKYGLGTPTAFNNAYTAYRAVLVSLSASTPENIAIPSDFSSKQTYYYNERTSALGAIADASISSVNDVSEQLEQMQQEFAEVKKDVAGVKTSVDGLKNFTDEAFADGIVDRNESAAVASHINSIETFAKDAAESYTKVYENTLLTGTAKTNLANAYTAFTTAKTELVTTINGAIADGLVDALEKSAVDGKYTAFNTKYGDFVANLNAANRAIQDAINQNALQALQKIGELDYLKAALKEFTTIEGGLIQSSTLALGYTSDSGYQVMAGTNGIYDASKLGGGIASWWGGAMFDRFEYTEETMPENVASALVRMDGTGYFAKGNLWWESDGTLHADPLSFFVGEETVGDVLGLFQFVKSDAGIEYVIPQYPFQKLEIGNYLQIGKAQLYWDEANQAFYVRHQDGVSPVGFYATGFISAKGANPNAGGAVSGASSLDELSDVALSNIQDGQVLAYDMATQKWVNKAVEAGLDEEQLDAYLTENGYATQEWVTDKGYLSSVVLATIGDLHASWDAILKAAPSAYVTRWPSAAEVGALTQSVADGRYVNVTGDTMSGTLVSPNICAGLTEAEANKYSGGVKSYWHLAIGPQAKNHGPGLLFIRPDTSYQMGIEFSTGRGDHAAVSINADSNDLFINNLKAGITFEGVGNFTYNGQPILHSGNYTNYTVTKTGSGASGTWPISISGNAYTLGGYHISNLATGGWTRFETYIYDETNGTRYYCYRIGNLNNTGDVILRIRVCDDINYPSYSEWTLRMAYNSSYTQVVTLLPNTPCDRTLTVYVDTSKYLWIKCNATWISYMQYKIEANSGSILITSNPSRVETAPSNIAYTITNFGSTRGGVANKSYTHWASTYVGALSGNASSATRLQTARTINGTSFDGTSNIVTSYWGTARTLSLTGNATGSVSMNGSANVSMNVNVNYATSAGNADTLDGVHNGNVTAAILASQGNKTAISGTTTAPSGVRLYQIYNNGYPCTYGNLISIGGSGQGELACEWTVSSALGHLYYRSKRDVASKAWSSWGTVAFTSDNVASATKLQTARTIWGQTFNGTAPVSGDMTGVGNISASGDITATSFYASYWFRSTGQTGWYSETYGGGWYMTDSSWLRAYNGKSILTTASIQGANLYATSRFYVSAYGTNYLGAGNGDNATTSTYNVKLHLHWGMAVTDNNDRVTMLFNGRSGTIFTTGGLYSNGYVSALGQNSSDARLKTNIQDFKATSLIKQLHPKSFKWNDLAKSKFEVFRNTGTEYGLIAQEVKGVLPGIVEDNLIGSGYMGIRYEKLIPVILQGTLENIGRLETVEERVKRLEKENKRLTKRIKDLERRMRA